MSERPYGIELYEKEPITLGDERWDVRNGVLGYIDDLEAKLETALRLLGESECPNGNCNRGTLRMFKGSSWDMENDLGPCPHCKQVKEVLGDE